MSSGHSAPTEAERRHSNKQGKGYPFPLLAISAEPYLYTILYNFHLFTNYLFYSKK